MIAGDYYFAVIWRESPPRLKTSSCLGNSTFFFRIKHFLSQFSNDLNMFNWRYKLHHQTVLPHSLSKLIQNFGGWGGWINSDDF